MRARFASAILIVSLSPVFTGTPARQTSPNTKNQGQLLIASRDLPDPLFHDSVVLMLPIKEGPLMVGLIINKPSKIKVRDVFPDSPALQKIDAMAYFGGPVDADVVARSAIFRSKTPPKDATPVFGDVYVSFDSDTIAALAGKSQQAATLRVFLGRAQWDPVQFENEVARGSWHSSPAQRGFHLQRVSRKSVARPDRQSRTPPGGAERATIGPARKHVRGAVPGSAILLNGGLPADKSIQRYRARPCCRKGTPVRKPCGSTPPRGGGGAS